MNNFTAEFGRRMYYSFACICTKPSLFIIIGVHLRTLLPLILGGSTHVMQNICWLLENCRSTVGKTTWNLAWNLDKSILVWQSTVCLEFPLIFHSGKYTKLIYSRQIWLSTPQKINMR